MSNNYFFRKSATEHADDALHIGLSAGGYFQFRAYTHATKRLVSHEAWMRLLATPGGSIVDDYDKTVSLEDFKRIVALSPQDAHRAVFRNSPVLRAGEPIKLGLRYRDEAGYLFQNAEFS